MVGICFAIFFPVGVWKTQTWPAFLSRWRCRHDRCD